MAKSFPETAVRKPMPPMFTPKIGMPEPAVFLAHCSIVPSPPNTMTKSAECACELYEDVVAPGLGSGLRAETWMNGATSNKIPTSCTGSDFDYDVEDIAVVKISVQRP